MNILEISSAVIYCTAVLGSLAPTHILVIRVGPCDDAQTTVVQVTEFSITTKTYDSTLNGTLNISVDIENGWRVKATMQKCQDIRNTDTCDYFKSYDLVKNGCGEEEDDDHDFYLMLFHYTKPRLSCPLKAGSYKMIQYPVFTEDNYLTVHETKISTSVFGYTYKLEGYLGDAEKLFCTEAYLQLLYKREHNWLTERKYSKNSQRTVKLKSPKYLDFFSLANKDNHSMKIIN